MQDDLKHNIIKKKSAVILNKQKKLVDVNPDIGTLVSLHHFSYSATSLWIVSSINDDVNIRVKNGTIALVVGHFNRGDGQQQVPLVLVNGFCGWVFRDEWDFVQST